MNDIGLFGEWKYSLDLLGKEYSLEYWWLFWINLGKEYSLDSGMERFIRNGKVYKKWKFFR